MALILRSSITYKGPGTENLIEFLRNGLHKNSDRILLIDPSTDRKWTGKEIEAVLSRLARYLIDECGLVKGNVCTIYGKTNDINVLLYLAVISAGGVSLYLTEVYRPTELLGTAKTSKCKYILSDKKLLQNSLQSLKEIDHSISVISCDEICEGFTNGCKTIGHLFMKDAIYPGYTCEELIKQTNIIVEEDFAVVQFSSGTTGKPKPIPRTHKNLCHLAVAVDHEELINLKPGEVIAGSLPLTHRPGLWALLACINGGSSFLLWSNSSDVLDALNMIQKYRITLFSSSLPLLAQIGNVGVANKDQYDLTSLKRIITSGAKIVHPHLAEAIVKEFNLISLRQCLGMTEAGWVCLIEESLSKDNYLTPGHVCPSVEAIILDRETGKPVAQEVRGEVALKGPQIFPGYLTEQDDIFNRSDFTEDGWFKTGDRGYYDSQNLIHIEGRYKELMILRNYRFFPNEIETIISEHPSVEGVCVIKIREFNETITYDIARAYVTLKQDCQLTEKELLDFLSEKSSQAILDGGVRFLDKFPRLVNGKVNKQALKEME